MAEVHRVYVLQNPRSRRYIGLSDDVERRVDQHNAGLSRWTKSRGPWTLVWQSVGMSLSAARKLENKLKRQKGGDGFSRLTNLSSHPGSESRDRGTAGSNPAPATNRYPELGAAS